MVMNKKGQMGFFFLFMIGITLFIVGFSLAPALIKSSDSTRSNLNCSNSSIDPSQKVTCGVVDIIAPWVTGLILGFGGMALGAKLIGV